MSQILRLEYTCTKAEREEAWSLSLRQQLGGGSKWRTWLVLLALLLFVSALLYFGMLRDLPLMYRPLVILAILVLSAALVYRRRKSRERPAPPTQTEVSATDFAILGPGAKVTIPWSGFSECLESPNLFALVDRPKATILIVPKRAFPSESWQTWFRAQADKRSNPAGLRSMPVPGTALAVSADRIAITVRLGFRDYLDRTTASWFTRGLMLAMAGIVVGTFVYAEAHPPPHPVISGAKVFFMFALPFLLVMMAVIILIISLHTWLGHRKHLAPQEWVLSEQSLAFAGRDATGDLPWTTYHCFKETPWSFILWRGQVWLMFPKRMFASADDVSRCRSLLTQNLKYSRWFLG